MGEVSAILLAKWDTSLLWPGFVEDLEDLLQTLMVSGHVYRGIRNAGYRDAEAQRVLYEAWQARTGGLAAPPWESAHQFHIAGDLFPDSAIARGSSPTMGDYAALIDACAEHPRLLSGWTFTCHDGPHVEARRADGVAWGAAQLQQLPRTGMLDVFAVLPQYLAK